jgi:hypothetical protein
LTTLSPNHHKSKIDYKEALERLKLVQVEKNLDFIEEWPEELALFDGQGGRPLAYVGIIPPKLATDPLFGKEESAYGSMQDEIQKPHATNLYCLDNTAVFEMLNAAIFEYRTVKIRTK